MQNGNYQPNQQKPGSSSSITPDSNENPSQVSAARFPNAKEAYMADRMAGDTNYQHELHQNRRRGMAGMGGAQSDELKAKYMQRYGNEWSNLSDDQRAEKTNGYIQNGTIDASHGVNASRIDAIKTNQGKQTANESLNGIVAGKGGNTWDNNSVAQEKGRLAIQNMIAEKTSNGVNPSTNEYVGIAPMKDITNGVVSDLSNQSTQEKDQSGKIRGAMTGLASRGQLPLVGAQAMTEQAQNLGESALNKSGAALDYGDPSSKVIATPYGTVAAKSGQYRDYLNDDGSMKYPNIQNSTNAASSGIADMKNQQAQGGTPIAEMLASKANKDLTDPSGDKYAAPITPPPNPTAQETDEKKKKRMQGSSQPSAPVQAQQATPTAPSSSI